MNKFVRSYFEKSLNVSSKLPQHIWMQGLSVPISAGHCINALCTYVISPLSHELIITNMIGVYSHTFNSEASNSLWQPWPQQLEKTISLSFVSERRIGQDGLQHRAGDALYRGWTGGGKHHQLPTHLGQLPHTGLWGYNDWQYLRNCLTYCLG